jgi:hypothetical protein
MNKVRPSPSTSATLYKVGTKKTGNDGNQWIVEENKNNIKRWKLYKKPTKLQNSPFSLENYFNLTVVTEEQLDKIKKKPNEDKIYNLIKKKFFPELNKLGFTTFVVPLPLSYDGTYWTDYASSYIREKYNPPQNIKYFVSVFYLNDKGEINPERKIVLISSELNKDDKIKVINLLNKYLENHYIWNGKNTEQIRISYSKVETTLDTKTVKEDDNFPLVNIQIYTKKNLDEDIKSKEALYDYFEKYKGKYNFEINYAIKYFSIILFSFTENIDTIKKDLKNFKFISSVKITKEDK